MKKTLLAVAAAFIGMSAQAATVAYSFSNPFQTTEISQTGSLGLFDGSLGILTGYTLTLNGGAIMSFGGTNTAAQAQRANLTSSVELFFTSDLAAVDAAMIDTILVSATSGAQQYAVGETKNFGPFAANGTDDVGGVALASFIGLGDFGVSCESLSGLGVVGGGGNIATTQSTTAGCGAEIVYTYTERQNQVPEPASLALVGLALAGAAAASRKRKA